MGNPVVHFDIGCRDKDKLFDFYAELFGWASPKDSPHSHSIDTGSDVGISGAITALGHEPHNYVMIYVEVEDMESYLAKIESLGGATVIPATEVPGQGHFAWFTDPEGTMMGLWKPSD